MTWRCAVENSTLGFDVKIALGNLTERGGQMLHFEPVVVTEYDQYAETPDSAWLSLPRDAAVALMLELQNVLSPDRRSVDREVLERVDEALAIERARVDLILDRDSRVIVTNGGES